MKELVFLLEEPSAREMLKGLLPRLLPGDLPIRYIIFEGKQDLERQLVRRLKGYRQPARFVVLRDQDTGSCRKVKQTLQVKCNEAGRGDTLVRIACRELESWYLADLVAVERGLELTGLARRQNAARLRSPDRVVKPSEELERLTAGGYRKVSGSRAIGPYLDPCNARSRSFAVFVSGLKRLLNI